MLQPSFLLLNLSTLSQLCSQYKSKQIITTVNSKAKRESEDIKSIEKERHTINHTQNTTLNQNDGIAYGSNTHTLDTEKLMNIASGINNNFIKIENLLANRIPLIDRDEHHDVIKHIQPDDILTPVTLLLEMPRDAILLVLMSVNTNVPNPCAEDIQQYPVPVPKIILSPPGYKFNSISWSPGQHRPISNYRYIHNFEIKSTLKAIMQENKSNSGTPLQRECNMIYMFLTKVLNQTRGINISRMILSQILTCRIRPSSHTIHHCHKEMNPSIYYLQQLLQGRYRWPFLDSSTGMIYPNSDPCSTQVPLLIYTILNRGLSWTMGVVTTGFFNLAMNVFFEWASTSLDDEHLLQKGVMNSVTKLLNERIFDSEILTFNTAGVSGTRHVEKVEEFWVDGEKEALLDKLNNTKTTRSYFDTIKHLMYKRFSRDELILYKMALECCTNTSTFKKSSPTLEYDRSAEHKIYNALSQPHAEVVCGGFAVVPRYRGTLKLAWDKLNEVSEKISQGLKSRNLEEEFAARLTNNSAGMTIEMISEAKKNHPMLKAMPSIPYGQRYITSLVDNDVLYDKAKAMADISSRVKAGERSQNDRRQRWIMMVSNVLQAAFSIALSYGRELAKISNFIASGKQVGDIRDMLQSLRSSAAANTIISDLDIKGMDSSTQEQIANFVINAVFKSLDGLDIPRYFYASAATHICTVHDEHGNVIGTRSMSFNAAQIFLMDVVGHMRSNSFEFTEGWIDVVTYINGAVFWSGAFHTAVQHNTFLSSVLEVLLEWTEHAFRSLQATFNASVSGDDISNELKFNQESKEADEAARDIIAELQRMLFDAGFVADPESSRCQATFLQQSALLGGVKPKFARLSPYVAEMATSRTKDPFGQIKEIGDILDEMSARSLYPQNVVPVLNSLWAVCRVMNLKRGIEQSTRFGNRLTKIAKHQNRYHRWIQPKGKYMTLVIPFVAIHLPEVFGITLPPMFLYGLGLKTPSFFMPKGTFTYWYLAKAMHKVLSDDEYNNLLEQQRERLNKDLMSKVDARLLSPEQAENLSSFEPYIPLKYLIDTKVCFEMGYSFSQWLWNVLPRAQRLASKDVEHPVFAQLVAIGKNKLNPEKMGSSQLAYQVLLDNGIRIPEGITYYNQPKARIIQAFALKNEKTRRYGIENESVVDAIYALVHDSKDVQFTFHDYGILQFKIVETEVPIELSSDAALLTRASLGGCAAIGSLTSDLTILFGTPFGTPARDLIVDQLKGELAVGADVELVLKEAYKVNKLAPEHLDTFFTAIGLNEASFAKVRRFISEYSQLGTIEYQSILNSRKYFYMSTHTAASNRVCAISQSRIGKFKWERLQKIIARDYFFAFPETKNLISIRPSRELMDRLVRV